MIVPNFQVKTEKETSNFGVYVIEPLEQGYGQTLGNALRRVLLSSLPGAAIIQAKISGAKHLFSTIKGLKEDVVELTLNLKKVRIRYTGDKPVKITLDKTGPGPVVAGDLETPAGVLIVNKDLVLGNLSESSSRLKAEFIVESGYGYVPFEEREAGEIGIIPLDGIFTPIQRVNYFVSATRVGRITNYDKLTIEIYTDGTIEPTVSLKEAAKILVSFFNQVVEPKETIKEEKIKEKKNEELNLMVEELELPTRIVNALLKEGLKTVGDIKQSGTKRISKIKNLGGKSLKIIEASLKEKGIEIGE